MAVAATFTNIEVPGAAKVGIAEISFTGSTDYLTNGIAVSASLFGLQVLDDCCPTTLGPSLASGIADFSWDKANQKIKLYTSSAVECANALDIHTIKIYCWVKGK